MINMLQLKKESKKLLKENVLKSFIISTILVLLHFLFFLCFVMENSIYRVLLIFLVIIFFPITRFFISKIFLKVVRKETFYMREFFKNIADINMFFKILWLSIVLFVSGITGINKIKSYSMAFYTLADNPDMTALEATRESEHIMNGHKMNYYRMPLLSSIYALLLPLTSLLFIILGLSLSESNLRLNSYFWFGYYLFFILIFTIPYIYNILHYICTEANFYEHIKNPK